MPRLRRHVTSRYLCLCVYRKLAPWTVMATGDGIVTLIRCTVMLEAVVRQNKMACPSGGVSLTRVISGFESFLSFLLSGYDNIRILIHTTRLRVCVCRGFGGMRVALFGSAYRQRLSRRLSKDI